MTPEDEEFNRIEMESRIKQESIRAMYAPHLDCPVCAENREARNLWRKCALDLWEKLKEKK